MTDIPTRVRELAYVHFGWPPITMPDAIPDTTTFHDIKADSLDIHEWLMLLEEEFKIGIDDDDAVKIVDLKSSIELVERMVKS